MTLKPIHGAVNIPFSRQRYEHADRPAKDVIIDYLVSNGHEILDTKEDFSVDIKSKKGYNRYFSEVEIKYGWKGDWNPNWKEIRLPYRKHKLINKVQSLDIDNAFFNFYIELFLIQTRYLGHYSNLVIVFIYINFWIG